jgi:hypothetical protein
MLENPSVDLAHKSTELYFIKGAINNLKLVNAAQVDQKLNGWSYYTNEVINELLHRVNHLESSIEDLTIG